MTTDLARLTSQGTLAALLITGRPGTLGMGALAGLTGAASGFAAPATTGLLSEVVQPADLQAGQRSFFSEQISSRCRRVAFSATQDTASTADEAERQVRSSWRIIAG